MHHVDGAVIVAMIAMGMMEMARDQVVEVIAVGNRLVTAAGAVNVARFVAAAVVSRSASVGIATTHRNRMLGHRGARFLVA
jgi:hypothetical protein